MIYTIEISSLQIAQLFDGWAVVDMHTNSHNGVQPNTFYVSESGLVIAEIKEEQKVLFKGIEIKEIN